MLLTANSTVYVSFLNSTYRAKPSPHPPRQEEYASGDDLLEIRSRKIRWITRPVRLHHRAARVRNEPLQRQDQEKHIIDFTEERNEVGVRLLEGLEKLPAG